MTAYEIFVKGTDKILSMFKSISSTTKETQKLNKALSETSKISKSLGDSKAFGGAKAVKNLTTTSKSVKDVEGQMKALKTIVATDLGFDVLTNSGKKFSNVLKALGKEDHLKNLSGALEPFNKGFSRGMTQGDGFLKSIGRGFSGVSKHITFAMGGLKGFMTTLAGAVLPILGIVAAFKILQRMWQLNVGGIQSQWGKLMGEIKTSIGKFNAAFNKVLRELSPLIEVLLKPLIASFKYVWAVAKGLFLGIWEVIKPIVNVFSELGTMLKEVFGGSNAEDMQFFDAILKGITFTLQFIGKILGFVLKVALNPLIKGFRALTDIFKWIKSTPLFDAMIAGAMTLKDIFVGIKDVVMGSLQTAWDFILGIINKIPDIFLPQSIQALKTTGSSASEAQTSNVNNIRNVNNNQNMTFNTGRATSPDQSQMFANMIISQLSR